MTRPLAYGIDFGTTNSSIAIAFDDRVEIVSMEGSGTEFLPSIAYLDRTGDRASGEAAAQQYSITGANKTRCSKCDLVDHSTRTSDCRQYRPGEGCNDSRLMVGVKTELAQTGVISTHSWSIDFDLSELVAVTLRTLKEQADRLVGEDVRRAVIGHPVAFVGTEGAQFSSLQATAEDRLRDAAAAAGLEDVVLYQEPAAAVFNEEMVEGTILAVDFGGGTFDCAVIELEATGGQAIALQGASIGGDLFDERIFDYAIEERLGLNTKFRDGAGKVWSWPGWLRGRIRTRRGAMHLLSNPQLWSLLRDLRRYESIDESESGVDLIENLIYGGHAYAFYKEIEATKIRLSEDEKADFKFSRPGIEFEFQITQAEFASLIKRDLDVAFEQVGKALTQAGVTASEVDLVVRTGGSSEIPSFVGRLESLFGPEKVELRPVFTTVAMGLATYAQAVDWS